MENQALGLPTDRYPLDVRGSNSAQKMTKFALVQKGSEYIHMTKRLLNRLDSKRWFVLAEQETTRKHLNIVNIFILANNNNEKTVVLASSSINNYTTRSNKQQ